MCMAKDIARGRGRGRGGGDRPTPPRQGCSPGGLPPTRAPKFDNPRGPRTLESSRAAGAARGRGADDVSSQGTDHGVFSSPVIARGAAPRRRFRGGDDARARVDGDGRVGRTRRRARDVAPCRRRAEGAAGDALTDVVRLSASLVARRPLADAVASRGETPRSRDPAFEVGRRRFRGRGGAGSERGARVDARRRRGRRRISDDRGSARDGRRFG